MGKILRFKIGDRVRILECEYANDVRVVGFEGKIIEFTNGDDYQYKVDLIDKKDSSGDTYALVADDEIELVQDEKENKMEKVKLEKSQANALEEAKKRHSVEKIISFHVSDGNGWMEPCNKINNMTLDELIRSLYFGYEVIKEQTSKEKVAVLLHDFYGFIVPETIIDEIENIYKR